jgi:hypothetical protein
MAVQQNGLALKHISEENKTSFEINLQAVKQNGLALEWVHTDFGNNREIVLEAVA